LVGIASLLRTRRSGVERPRSNDLIAELHATVAAPSSERTPPTGWSDDAAPRAALGTKPPLPQKRPRVTRDDEFRAAVFRAALDLGVLVTAALATVALDSGLPISGTAVMAYVVLTLTVLHATAIRAVRPRLRLELLDDARLIVSATAVAAIVSQFLAAAVTSDEPSAYDTMRLWGVSATLLVIAHGATIMLVHRRRRMNLVGMRTLVVGAGQVGRLAARRLLNNPELGLHPIGFLDKDPIEIAKPLGLPLLGASWNLEEVVEAHRVECVVITFSTAPHDVLLGLLDECARLGVRTLVVPRLFERYPSRVQLTHVGALPLLELMPTSTKSLQYVTKYAFDRIAAALLVTALSPILLIVAASVLLSLGRPILYRQERVGRDGRRFDMLKFRTMAPASEDAPQEVEFNPESAPGGVEGADRRTPVGTWLRRTSLDELAQLFNVLRGDMSLVGPRPERPEFVQFFGDTVRRYGARHRVKSGITGWAQIHRLRGKTSIADRVEWDNYYIENFSLWLDVKILLRTIPEVFRGATE